MSADEKIAVIGVFAPPEDADIHLFYIALGSIVWLELKKNPELPVMVQMEKEQENVSD
jgi:hypothetical protein